MTSCRHMIESCSLDCNINYDFIIITFIKFNIRVA